MKDLVSSGRANAKAKKEAAERRKDKNKIRYSGDRVDMLTVLGKVGAYKDGRNALLLCRCDCGNYKIVSRINMLKYLRRDPGSKYLSCGCHQIKIIESRRMTESEAREKYFDMFLTP